MSDLPTPSGTKRTPVSAPDTLISVVDGSAARVGAAVTSAATVASATAQARLPAKRIARKFCMALRSITIISVRSWW